MTSWLSFNIVYCVHFEIESVSGNWWVYLAVLSTAERQGVDLL